MLLIILILLKSYNLKNIVGLTVAKLFIHNKQRNIGYQSTVKSFINNNPYLIVDLDGFNDINDILIKS